MSSHIIKAYVTVALIGLVIGLVMVLNVGCGDGSDDARPQPSVDELFDPGIKTIEIEVDYLPDADPYTGKVGDLDDLWDLFRINVQELFPDKTIVYPSALSEMEEIHGEQRFGEQITLIHEFGHAIGLVNRGIPVTSDHHDDAHGAHCTNPLCIMYYQNAQLVSLLEFAQDFVDTGNTSVFESGCLNDIQAFSNR